LRFRPSYYRSIQYCNMRSLFDLIRQILKERSLTLYGASKLISNETDEPIKTVHQRLTRYLDRSPESWAAIEADFRALGYKITIEKGK